MRMIHAEMKAALKPFLAMPEIEFENGKKHARVRNTRTNDWLPIPGSPGDRRSILNFTAAVKRLVNDGEGIIFARSGRVPSH